MQISRIQQVAVSIQLPITAAQYRTGEYAHLGQLVAQYGDIMPAIVADGISRLDMHHSWSATHVVDVAHVSVDEFNGQKVTIATGI